MRPLATRLRSHHDLIDARASSGPHDEDQQAAQATLNPALALRAALSLALPTLFFLALAQKRRARSPSRPRSKVEAAAANHPPRGRASFRAHIATGGGFRRADLRGAMLDKLDLNGLDLSRCDARHATFRRADMSDTKLTAARLEFADFESADLRRADLTEANVLEVSFQGADLRGARLAGCRGFGTAHFRKARYDDTTTWPPGFDPQRAGAHRRGATS